MRGNKSVYNESQWRWVYDRYMEGYMPTEIAGAIFVHRNTVSYHIKRFVDMYGDRPPIMDRREEFLRLGEED